MDSNSQSIAKSRGSRLYIKCESVSLFQPVLIPEKMAKHMLKAGFLTCPCYRAFSSHERDNGCFATTLGDGTYSSGYCSGLTPDFLLKTHMVICVFHRSAPQNYIFFTN